MKRSVWNWLAAGLMVASLVALVVATVLLAGIENTSSGATDSQGRAMGFNDHLSKEHYAIILRNFHLRLLLRSEYAFDWLIFTAHFVGLFLLAYPRKKLWQCFFGLQMALTPIALFGWVILIHSVPSIVEGTMDREGFTDIPSWNLLASLPLWVTASALALVRARDGSGAVGFAAS